MLLLHKVNHLSVDLCLRFGDASLACSAETMAQPSKTVVFADAYRTTGPYQAPRFVRNAAFDSTALTLAHSGRTSVAFADGSAAMKTGQELKDSPWQLAYWYNTNLTPED